MKFIKKFAVPWWIEEQHGSLQYDQGIDIHKDISLNSLSNDISKFLRGKFNKMNFSRHREYRLDIQVFPTEELKELLLSEFYTQEPNRAFTREQVERKINRILGIDKEVVVDPPPLEFSDQSEDVRS